ncbi:MAG: battenin CLN3 protein [Claussenomyces sp. TS43310]|nr:MAG: battenin CLN3 protein [Claussenomyces sp. TS43310]
MFPVPGSPASSWALCRARLQGLFQGADSSIMIAFWLFGLINNVLYVIILSAALDLVGPDVPKGVVLLADVMPSFATKLIAPYFIHKIPYNLRIIIFVLLSSGGMFLLALTPSAKPGQSVGIKLFGVVLASLSSGGGELSFLGLTHYYGHFSLAAWGSGTGGAGLAGAGLYVLLTTWLGFSVKSSLLASAFLPIIMLISFFVVLPHGPLHLASRLKHHESLPTTEEDVDDIDDGELTHESLLTPRSTAVSHALRSQSSFMANVRRARFLFFPYMLPLLLVYISEYTINQGVSPTLLFPLKETPFDNFRSFYPFYGFLYQIGVFIARSSTPFIRLRALYLPSILQIVNLALLTSHALYDWIPNVYLVFLVIFWEGLLGGAVYVNTFASILDDVPAADREFSLGATSVSDSGGICVAGFISMTLEVSLCNWQVNRGRNWCKQL